MAFDAVFLTAVLDEIRAAALGARVEKLHQPARDTVIIHLRCAQGRRKLLIAANPSAPRLHFTQSGLENPDAPPMFCMLLRKHLTGGRLTEIRQLPMERTAEFVFDCVNELGDPVQKRLVAELMGRTSNLYLLDPDRRILDCLRRVGFDGSARRQALPGLFYQPPEPLTRLNPAVVSADELTGLLAGPGPDLLAKRLQEGLGGLSPLVCREAALYAAGDTEYRLSGAELPVLVERTAAFLRRYVAGPERRPYLLDQPGAPRCYAFCPILQYAPAASRELPDFGTLCDAYYAEGDRQSVIRQKSQSIRRTVSNLTDRVRRKLALQEQELEATQNRERLRQLGDIVTANLHSIGRGQTRLTAVDFYDEAMPEIQIPLAPHLSPQQNAARFYKDYNKAKHASRILSEQLELGRTELAYLTSVQDELERAETAADLEEIRAELTVGGYLRPEPGRKRMRQPALEPLRFLSSEGYPILVGRNNRQNDFLTWKLARKDDLWLHVQKLHGSHVVIQCAGTTPPDDTITQAAELAVWYSQGRQGQNLPVDVTPVRFVKKPGTAKPGMVIYHQYRTVFVTPEPGLPEKLASPK